MLLLLLKTSANTNVLVSENFCAIFYISSEKLLYPVNSSFHGIPLLLSCGDCWLY